MAFRNLTNSGKAYLATRLANELPVKFTKAKIGNGGVPTSTDPAQTTELYGFKKQVTILKAVQEQNSIKLTIQITNDGINEGFYLKEIGIYVDDNGREVLYWYCNEDNSQYINAQTDTPLSFEVDIMMEVTNINSTVVEWTGKDTWVNKTLLNEELAKKLDKGAVSSEYDTAKKIEDKIKTAQGTADSKLDKSNVPEKYNTAEKIGNEVELKQNKTDDKLKTKAKNVVDSINERFWHYGGIDLSVNHSLTTELSQIKENGLFFTHINPQRFTDIPFKLGLPFVLKNMYYLHTSSDNESGAYMIQKIIGASNAGTFIREIDYTNIPTRWKKYFLDEDVYEKIAGVYTEERDKYLSYIQRVGVKNKDQSYIDEVTGKIYIARETNEDTTVTNKFELITNTENAKRINSFRLLTNGTTEYYKLNKSIIIPKNVKEIYIRGHYQYSDKTELPYNDLYRGTIPKTTVHLNYNTSIGIRNENDLIFESEDENFCYYHLTSPSTDGWDNSIQIFAR